MRTQSTRTEMRGDRNHQAGSGDDSRSVEETSGGGVLLADKPDATGSALWARGMHYLRQDELDLARRVQNFLAGRNQPGLRRLSINVDGSSVVLRGVVRTYYEKQLAVHCCQRVAGVISVVDGIEVAM